MTKEEAFSHLSNSGLKPFYEDSLLSIRVDSETMLKKALSNLHKVGYHSTIRVIIENNK